MPTARTPVVHEIVGVWHPEPQKPQREIAVDVERRRPVQIEVHPRSGSTRHAARMWHEQWLEMLG
jgi:hypothetical protein